MIIVRDEGFCDDDLASAQFFLPEQIDWTAATGALVDVGNEVDPSILQNRFSRIRAIRITFADSADGRGFSIASKLRRLGYRGRLRAHGHVIADQFPMARRSGFDEVAISETLARRQPESQWHSKGSSPTYQQRLTDGLVGRRADCRS